MGWLDNIIGWISPEWGARREVWRQYMNEVRHYDAGDSTKAVELVLRGSQQYTDRATGNVDQMGMRVVFRGRAKKLSPGDMKQGKAMNGSVTLGLTYIYIELDGNPKFELDKLNSVFKVNGVDLLAKVRKYT